VKLKLLVATVSLGVASLGALVVVGFLGVDQGTKPKPVAVIRSAMLASSTTVSSSRPPAHRTTPPAKPAIVHGVNQQLVARCIATGGNCEKTVPGLALCMEHYRVCNETAAARQATGNPIKQPATPSAALMTESEAVKRAGGGGGAVTGVGVEMLPYASISKIDPAFISPTTTSTREVWLVSVYLDRPITPSWSPPPGDPASNSATISSYTVVIDAETGVETDYCYFGLVPAGTTDPNARTTVPPASR
jgi:hypothetical protein